ncbi:MAG TPA: hypothetical protein VG796_29680 [Verrucomicrobiales bacterium]|nr:hypothetical protein [Verrucomicrobiales bacterium]
MQDPDDETPRDVDNDEFYELFENAPWSSGRSILQRRGFEPLRPDGIPDDQVAGCLWELLYALAAQRVFFHGTDGLTDAALYRYLDQWLDEPHQDVPLCLEMNCRHDCSGSEDSLEFLKYADDETRAMWQEMEPEAELPPKETPPADRDRFMPRPPEPPHVPDDATGGIPPEWLEEDGDDDPLGLASVDDAIAANNRANAEPEQPPTPPPCENWQRPDRELQRTGFTPVPPDELTDETLTAHLWQLLHQLAIRNFFVTHTDHLSDADLYRNLWTGAIRGEALMPPARSQTAYWMHDVLGSYGDEELEIELAVYATDEARARHVSEYPGIPLPDRRDRLIRRDWRLPRPPF